MKIAVLLFGEIRGDNDIWKNVYNRIIAPNNADVFMHHVYYEPDFYVNMTPSEIKMIKEYYHVYAKGVHYYPPKELFDIFKPKRVLFESRPSYHAPELEEIMKKIEETMSIEECNMLYHTCRSQSESRKRVIELKQQYELEHNFVYDAVIMTRLDIALLQNVVINTPLQDLYAKIYFHAHNCPSYCVPQIREQIIVGSSKLMDTVIATFHNAAPELYLELCNPHSGFRQNEHFMAQHIHRCGVNIIDCDFGLNYYADESINGISRAKHTII